MTLEIGGYCTDKGVSGMGEYAGGCSEGSAAALPGGVMAARVCVTFAAGLLPRTEPPK